MKIAIVLNTSWNIHNFRMNFIKSIQEKGHEVHTVAPVDQFTQKLIEQGCFHHNVRMDSRGANPIKDFALIFELFFIYRRMRPDVILHYTIKPNVYGTLAAAMLDIPVINNVCGLGTVFLKRNIVSFIAIWLYKIAFRYPKKIFFQNPDDLKLFLSMSLVNRETADLVQGSGIDLRRFSPVNYSRNNKFTFLLISRLITDKGILEYIEAIRKLKAKGIEAKFQLLGALDLKHKRTVKKKSFDKWIEEGIVDYLGTTLDVRPYIYSADCVVLPSYREGTPRTLLEAASSGKPIIATDVPGCHQVVEDKVNGLLCKLKSVDDLAEKMEIMAKLDDETLKRFGRNGRLKVEKEYDEQFVINKYLAAFDQLNRAT